MADPFPEMLRCPVCGGRAELGRCEPWHKQWGPQPWYANCYSTQPIEHCVAVNGDTQRETMENWNTEVSKAKP